VSSGRTIGSRELQDASARYQRILEADPEAAREQAERLREAFLREGITYAGAALPSFVRPHLLARAQWDALRGAAVRVMETAARVAREVFDGDVDRLCAFLGVPEEEVAWVKLDPGLGDVQLSRLDAFLTPDGPHFVEINSDAPAGFGYGDRMARLVRELPVFRRFEREVAVSYHGSSEALVRAVAACWRASGGTGRPRIAIADWEEVETRADQQLLREAFLARGFDCVLADPREMDVRGGRLNAGGAPVDLVYRRAVLSELVGREIEVQPFMGAYRHGLCPFVNSFRCRLSEDKAFFAILTDESFGYLLSAEERALVARVLPWTRRVEERWTEKDGTRIDLVPYAIAHRESLVLKPAHEWGGRSVVLGWETSPLDWAEALRAALGAPWVVQQRVAIPEEPFPVFDGGRLETVPLKLNANPFYVRGEEAGVIARASRSSIVNVSAGGGSVPTFVVG
jgi:uncharacterized circularly permuted ATP-grasp superfamily protein